MEIYDRKNVAIKCPLCHKLLCRADNRDTRTKVIGCSNCQKLIYFNAAENTTEVKRKPLPNTSSGKRLY